MEAYSILKNGNEKLSEHFKVREFYCRDGSDPVFIDTALVEVLEKIRTHFGKPVTMELLIPYSQGSLVHRISEAGEVAKTEYQNDGTYMQVTFTPSAKDHALMQEVASYRIG